MKKVINNVENVIPEMLEGVIEAYGDFYKKTETTNGIVLKEKKDKVGVLIGGGSGHEPLFFGFVGNGLADGAAIGNVFAAPTPDTILEVTQAIDAGKGVLYLYGNYSGDVLNFDMAAELADFEGIATKTVAISDDVASAPKDKKRERRGIAGDVMVFKVAGAAADSGLSLEEVALVAAKANDHTGSIGVALSPGTIPGETNASFSIGEDEIEFGMGLHGEPGVKRSQMLPANQLTSEMMDLLFADMDLAANDEVCVLVNGLGSTTLLELFIVNKEVSKILKEKDIKVFDTHVNSYCTTQEMGGFSITLLKLDDELKKYYAAPAYSPFYVQK
ncbi:dihydroxyacetone kinase [Bacillus sp. SORGH_AS 510]|uniref:dihydroxyacetone kinase subunit DhaK n=1 Tax=Bacillus sp. SORGH_AS_0510 TaxID=3041771 RepID=UPI00278B51F3|nr:dihydroxyacetone kinase subunit DhaK [Bacillus sp. SORGH_AS_0510]MDQ1143792.1 dihydroxyacetone kinase [Bacillus sp. SORGH_AS_0510]